MITLHYDKIPIKAALEGPITPDCLASILRTQQHVKLYLDRDATSLLGRFGKTDE